MQFPGLAVCACVTLFLPAALCAQQPELVVQDRVPGKHVTLSPDGRLFATTDEYGETLLWESASGRLLRVLLPITQTLVERRQDGESSSGGLGSGGFDAVFSPDGRYVAAVQMSLKLPMNGGAWDWNGKAPSVWEVASGRPQTTGSWYVTEKIGRSAEVPWTSSELIAWGAVTDTATARRLAAYKGSVRALSANGRTGVALDGERDTRVITIRELPSDREIARLPGTFHDTWLIALSPDARWLAMRSQAAGIEVWDVGQVRKVTTLDTAQSTSSEAIGFSPDGRYLAIAGGTEVRAYSTADWTRVFTQPQPPQTTTNELTFSRDSKVLAVSRDGIDLYQLPSGKLLRHVGGSTMQNIDEWTMDRTSLVIARSGFEDTLYPHQEASLEVWPLAGGAPRQLADSMHTFSSVALSPDGQTVAGAIVYGQTIGRYTHAQFGGVGTWDLRTGKTLLDASEESDAATEVVFTPDGSHLLTTRYEDTITERPCDDPPCGAPEAVSYNIVLQRINLRTRAHTKLLTLGATGLDEHTDTRISPRADRVLARTEAGARMISLKTMRRLPMFRGAALKDNTDANFSGCLRDQNVRSVFHFSPDGTRLAVQRMTSLTIVSATTGARQFTRDLALDEDDVRILGARFTPDGKNVMLVTCNDRERGSRVRFADLTRGGVRTLLHLDDAAQDVLFAENVFLVRTGPVVRIFQAEGLLGTLLRDVSGEWLVITPSGLYDASPRGAELAMWRQGTALKAPSSLPTEFRVPGLLGKLMRGEKLIAPAWP